jgi:DNA polymerase-3 subunit alpha
MPALAITDHGNMFGAIRFYNTCREKGLKPIIGLEAYCARESRFDKKGSRTSGDKYFHLTLLARDMRGYRNLMKLSTLGFTEGFYYKPRIDMELIERYHEGLIALSGCLKGQISQLLLRDEFDAAVRLAGEFETLFGRDNFYLEIMDHGIPEELKVKEGLIRLNEKTGIPLVATNDCHYLHQEDAKAHDALLCIQTGKTLNDKNRIRFSTDQVYFKSPDEMAVLFSTLPHALSNTRAIAERCNLRFESSTFHLPHFGLPKEFEGSYDEYLKKLVLDKLTSRYREPSEDVMKRIHFELEIIDRMGFSSYFLIVHDLIERAKEMNVPVGPGRGSAAASIISYILGITDVDPLEHNLIFERFLNPERLSMPDIDIDFCFTKRNKVLEYVIKKYGRDNVCQIITFGTIKARAAIRDVGRVMDIPYAEVDRIAKMIPAELGITIEKALEDVPELRELVANNERYGSLIEIARKLEGQCRHASIHAAGVVVTPRELIEYTPLYKTNNDEITTQYDMKSLEELGILKMDFLGLRTLTVIQNCLDMLGERGVDLDMSGIPVDDAATFELLREAKTVGVFQLESRGMRDLLLRIKPDRFEDIVAANALFRPGPMERVDEYVMRKHGQKKIDYDHPLLEKILSDTYGVMIYQEQVMQTANALAGFTLGQADRLRKAMGKKITEIMDEQRHFFLEGVEKKKINRRIAEDVFDQIKRFAGYGFNKAHSTAYSLISYRTAYLKAHYPHEFMAANLTSELNDTSRITILINECRTMGIEVLPPDVNESTAAFGVSDGKIRFGLGAIKNVGLGAIESIVSSREGDGIFETLADFCQRTDLRLVNKRVIESLILCGAMDGLQGNRAQLFAIVDQAITRGQRYQKEANSRQASLFEAEGVGISDSISGVALPEIEGWPVAEKLKKERELLGFYISGHPLIRFEQELEIFTSCALVDLKEMSDTEECTVGGLVVDTNEITTRRGKPMAFVSIEDLTGVAEVVVFTETFQRSRDLLTSDSMIIVRGRVDSAAGKKGTKVIADSIFDLKHMYDLESPEFSYIELSGKVSTLDESVLLQLRDILSSYRGNCPVYFSLMTSKEHILRLRMRENRVALNHQLLKALRSNFPEIQVFVKLNHRHPSSTSSRQEIFVNKR